jgi:hypothetical protein
MAYSDQGADPDAGQRDGTEGNTARLLFAGTAATVVLRGVTWALSSLTIGPLLGVLDMFVGAIGRSRAVSLVQAVVCVAAVVTAVVCAAGLRHDPARFRRPIRVLAFVFVADVVIYLAPIIVVAAINPGLNTLAWVLFLVAAVGNVALAWLAVVIAGRTRRVPIAAV